MRDAVASGQTMPPKDLVMQNPLSGTSNAFNRIHLLLLAMYLVGIALSVSDVGYGQPTRPVLIGALTESWGPTPNMVGLRDGLQKLGTDMARPRRREQLPAGGQPYKDHPPSGCNLCQQRHAALV